MCFYAKILSHTTSAFVENKGSVPASEPRSGDTFALGRTGRGVGVVHANDGDNNIYINKRAGQKSFLAVVKMLKFH